MGQETPLHMMNHDVDDAVGLLRRWVMAGKLDFPQPWINKAGDTVVSWDPNVDGTLLDCYIDMLGLNGREPNETREGRIEYEKWLSDQRQRKAAAVGQWVSSELED